MNWGGRKTSSSGSQKSSPFSWLSKFKQMGINSEPNPAKIKHKKEKQQKSSSTSGSAVSSSVHSYHDSAVSSSVYSSRRQSFGEDSQDKKSNDFDEYVRRDPVKNCRREGTLKLKEKGEDHRNLLNDRKISKEMMDDYNREKEYEHLRRRFERKAQEVLQAQLLKLERQVLREVEEFASGKEVEKDVLLQFDSPRTICTPRAHSFASSSDSKNSSLRNIVEDRGLISTQCFEKNERPSHNRLSPEKQNLKVKTEKQKQPIHASKELHRRKPKHSSKVRIHSPRLASISKVESCKIKAIEDMRKAKLKLKKEREKVVEETQTPEFDSFAVIKSSLDPKQDFRDSMIEMIMVKQISQPEEMEELLACYLTLNADEYHDLIIKVFRQVWFDMSQYGLGTKSDMQCYCYE